MIYIYIYIRHRAARLVSVYNLSLACGFCFYWNAKVLASGISMDLGFWASKFLQVVWFLGIPTGFWRLVQVLI